MADERKPDAAPLALRERIAKAVGLDPTKATNDDCVVAALEEAVADVEQAKAERATGLTPEEAKAANIDAAVERELDIQQIADGILSRAEQIRNARMLHRGPDAERNVRADVREAAKAAPEIMKSVADRGGVLGYVQHDRKASMRQLLAMETADPNIRMIQRANDDILFLGHLMGVGSNPNMQGFESLSLYRSYMETMNSCLKAMDTTDGSAWTPTVYSYDLQENVYQTTAVARLFPRSPWIGTGGTMSVPVEGTDITIYGAAEATTDDDDPKYTASTPGPGTTVTATAKSIAARTIWSIEMEEDSIVPYLDHARAKFVREFARGFDEALLDGDTSATHQDTGFAVVTGDRRKQFSGLRYKGLNDSTTLTSAGTYFNWEQLMTPALLMGKYAQGMEGSPNIGPAGGGQRMTDTVFICSHGTRTRLTALRDTRNNNIYLTPRYLGDADARALGYRVITDLGGYQIVPSAKVRSDMNASGIYDDSTKTKTYALFVYCPAFHIYDKRQFGMQLVERPEQGQRVLVGTMRLAFQHMYASTEHTVGMLYNFADTSFGTG